MYKYSPLTRVLQQKTILYGMSHLCPMLIYDDNELYLQDEARACYLSFFKVFDARFYSDTSQTRHCVKLTYTREIEAGQLAEATLKIYRKIYGEELDEKTSSALDTIGESYRGVSEGDSYQYCIDKSGNGELIRDKETVVLLQDEQLAGRIMTIWRRNYDSERAEWNFSKC